MPELIAVKITGDAGDLQRAVGDATGSVGGLGKSTSSLLNPALLGAVGAAGLAAAAIASMTMAAAADRDEQAKLETAIKAAGAATGDYTGAVDEAIRAGAALAFSDSEVRAALEPLVQTTGDMTEANALLATAQDVARLAGVDLETASKAVAKAHEGQGGALTRLIPALAGVEEGTDLVAEAQRLATGQADTFAKSTEGQLKRSGDAFGELQETIGSAFLPVLDEIVPILIPIVETLGELLRVIIPPLTVVIKHVAGAFKLWVDVIRTIMGIIGDLIGKIRDLLKPLEDALGMLGGLLDFKMPSFDFPDLNPFSLPGGDGGTSAGARARGGIVINTGADPASVIRIVRAHIDANGGHIAVALVAGADIAILADLEPVPFVLDVNELDREESVLTPTEDALGDIACEVVHAQWQWGATVWAGPMTVPDAGSCSLVVADPGRRFDPGNPDNPRPIQLGSPLVITVDGARAWSGYVREVTHDHAGGLTTLVGGDAITALAQVAYDGLTPAGTTWAILGSILDRSQWSQALRVTYGAPAAYRSAGVDPENVWAALVRNALAEGGLIWCDRDGRIAQRARGLLPESAPAPPVIGCEGADLAALTTGVDRQGVRNHVLVEQTDTLPTTEWREPVSVAAYGPRTLRVRREELRLELAPGA